MQRRRRIAQARRHIGGALLNMDPAPILWVKHDSAGIYASEQVRLRQAGPAVSEIVMETWSHGGADWPLASLHPITHRRQITP